MKTIIGIQDEFIARISKLDPRSRNYFTNLTKASKAARKSLVTECGFDINMADEAVIDAYDVYRNENAAVFDPLNN